MKHAHQGPVGGHFGYDKTCQIIRQKYDWTTLNGMVAMEIAGCAPCQSKLRSKQGTATSQHINKGGVWQDLSLDFAGPAPAFNGQSIAILVCNTSKYMEARVTPNQTSETVTDFLKDAWSSKHGPGR